MSSPALWVGFGDSEVRFHSGAYLSPGFPATWLLVLSQKFLLKSSLVHVYSFVINHTGNSLNRFQRSKGARALTAHPSPNTLVQLCPGDFTSRLSGHVAAAAAAAADDDDGASDGEAGAVLGSQTCALESGDDRPE